MNRSFLLGVIAVATAFMLMGADEGGCAAPSVNPGNECKQASDCEGQTHTECVGRWLCQSGTCSWDCSAGGTCTTDADCATEITSAIGCADGTVPKNLCLNGTCQLSCGDGQDCTSDTDCPEGQYCQTGTCPLCANGTDGTKCISCTGKCVSEQFPCSSDRECPEGYYCMFDPGTGKDTTNPSDRCGGAIDAGAAPKCVVPQQGVCVKNPDEVKCLTDSDCPKGFICATTNGTDPGDPSSPKCVGIKCVPPEGVCIPGDKCYCNEIYAPVCGTDGVTYGNPCFARCAWVQIAYEGECKPVCTCYAKYGEICGRDYKCDKGYECDPVSGGCCSCTQSCKKELACSSDKDCPLGTTGWQCVNGCCELRGCSCPLYYEPVCGTDGKTYSNECEAKCAGVGIVSKGECAVTECYSDKDCKPGYYCAMSYKCADPSLKCGGPGVCMPVECPPVACTLYCEYGFERDANGCEICKCAAGPGVCKTYTDAAGNTCTICCDQSTGVCSETCNGGCAGSIQCKSNEECLPINKAKMVCQNGCCVPEGCQPNNCDLYCEYGFMTDAGGCEICKCNTPPVECKTYYDSAGNVCERCCTADGYCKDSCSTPCKDPVVCDLYCEYGYERDANGCEICRCIQPPVECKTYYDSAGNICEKCCDPTTGQCWEKCSGGCAAGLPACNTDYDCSNSGGILYYACVNGCCQEKPVDCNCTKEYLPVCGLDNVTYGNACEATCRSGGVAYKGPCRGTCIETYAPCKDDTMCPDGTACFNGSCCKI